MENSKFRFRTYENAIVLMMFFTFGFVFMERLSITFLFPFIKKDLHLTDTEIGMLASVLSVCWALSGYFFSSVADFVDSRKKILIPITFAFSIFSFLSGIARSFFVLFLARGLMGIAEGPSLPLAQSTAAIESTPKRKGLNSGFLQSSSQLVGATFTPIIVTALAVHFSWHVAFYIVGIPGLIMTLILWRFMKDRKVSDYPAEEKVSRRGISWAEYMNVFKRRNVWLCVVISACFMTWLFAYSTFAPTFFITNGYTPGQMSLIMAGVGLGSFAWTVVIPTISDRWGRKPSLILFSFMAIISPVVFALFHLPVWAMFLIALLVTTGNGLFPMFMVVIPGESIPAGIVTTAIALVQLVGELVGGTIMPTVSGAAAGHFGLSAPLWIAAVGAFVAGVVGFGLIETAPSKVKAKQALLANGASLSGN